MYSQNILLIRLHMQAFGLCCQHPAIAASDDEDDDGDGDDDDGDDDNDDDDDDHAE